MVPIKLVENTMEVCTVDIISDEEAAQRKKQADKLAAAAAKEAAMGSIDSADSVALSMEEMEEMRAAPGGLASPEGMEGSGEVRVAGEYATVGPCRFTPSFRS